MIDSLPQETYLKDREYPVAPERSGNTQDYANYVSFLGNLRQALGSNGHKYGLTITIPQATGTCKISTLWQSKRILTGSM